MHCLFIHFYVKFVQVLVTTTMILYYCWGELEFSTNSEAFAIYLFSLKIEAINNKLYSSTAYDGSPLESIHSYLQFQSYPKHLHFETFALLSFQDSIVNLKKMIKLLKTCLIHENLQNHHITFNWNETSIFILNLLHTYNRRYTIICALWPLPTLIKF